MVAYSFSRVAFIGFLCLLGLLAATALYMHVYWTLPIPGLQSSSSYSGSAEGGVTIRVNTFKRIDLLEVFVDYYLGKAGNGGHRKKNCDLVKQIQVVWSDTSAQPPASWVKQYGGGAGTSTTDGDRLVFEVHAKDSLNNRFLPSTEIKTEAVLSVDDDLIIPCDVLAENLHVWRSFDKTLVGFSPRAYAYDAVTGAVKYLRWQHTWWSGFFSIMLTKASFLHRDYLGLYATAVPPQFLAYVDSTRNCEDIAMAHVVASASRSPPVWVGGEIYEIGSSGISSGGSHFADRGLCLQKLRDLSSDSSSTSKYHSESGNGLNLNGRKGVPWVTGYAKVLTMGLLDYFYLGA